MTPYSILWDVETFGRGDFDRGRIKHTVLLSPVPGIPLAYADFFEGAKLHSVDERELAKMVDLP